MKLVNMNVSRKNTIILIVMVVAVAIGVLAMRKKQEAPMMEAYQTFINYPTRGPANSTERALVNYVKTVVVRLIREARKSSAGGMMTMTVDGWNNQGKVAIIQNAPGSSIMGFTGTTLALNPKHSIVTSKPKLHMGIIWTLASLETVVKTQNPYNDVKQTRIAAGQYVFAAKKLGLPLEPTREFRDPFTGSISAT